MGIVAVAAATLLAGTASGERNVAVSLTVVGNPGAKVIVTKGKPLTFTTRAAMRSGDILGILVLRPRESKARIVAACKRSPCSGRWIERGAVSDQFQALLVRPNGNSSTAVGRSRIVRVTWKAATPPPRPRPRPAPAASSAAPAGDAGSLRGEVHVQ